jgi:hypothetical protein
MIVVHFEHRYSCMDGDNDREYERISIETSGETHHITEWFIASTPLVA